MKVGRPAALLLSYHTGLVPILHLGVLQLCLQKHYPMFSPFTGFCHDWELNPDHLCSSTHADHHTKGPS